MKALQGEADFKVTWKPFFLNPNTPKEGIPLVEYISSRYGAEAGRKVRDGKSPLVRVGKELGITFNHDRFIVNTLKSHCMLEMAQSSGNQDAVADALFKIYFEDGSDISTDEVLLKVAEDLGLNKEEVKKSLEDTNLHESIKKEAQHATLRGIHGVPFFDIFIDGYNNQKPFNFSGAQDSEAFVDVFKRLLNLIKSKA